MGHRLGELMPRKVTSLRLAATPWQASLRLQIPLGRLVRIGICRPRTDKKEIMGVKRRENGPCW
jgi:hypothetical protein